MKRPLSPMTSFFSSDLSSLFLVDINTLTTIWLKDAYFFYIAICWIKFGIPNLNPRVLVEPGKHVCTDRIHFQWQNKFLAK